MAGMKETVLLLNEPCDYSERENGYTPSYQNYAESKEMKDQAGLSLDVSQKGGSNHDDRNNDRACDSPDSENGTDFFDDVYVTEEVKMDGDVKKVLYTRKVSAYDTNVEKGNQMSELTNLTMGGLKN